MPLFKKILQEPLLHFLVVGSLLFFYLSNNDTSVKEQVIISEGKIRQLTAQFTKTRQRVPDTEELQGLIEIQIREDLAFKHGEQMRLIENDTIIKRRVQQKVEFMLNDSIASIDPTEEELQNYLNEHKEKFMIDPVYSFRHIYINTDKHKALEIYIAMLQNKNLDDDYKTLGDSLMLESEYKAISSAQIARLFGLKFTKNLDALGLHQWLGPVKSGFGVHLVIIDEKSPRRLARLDEVESELRLDFRVEAQKKAINTFYEELAKQYNVVVEQVVQ